MNFSETQDVTTGLSSLQDDPAKDENDLAVGFDIPVGDELPTELFTVPNEPLNLGTRLLANLAQVFPGQTAMQIAWVDLARTSITVQTLNSGPIFLSDDPVFLNDQLSITGSSPNVFLATQYPLTIEGYTGPLYAYVVSAQGWATTLQTIGMRKLT